MNRRDLFKLIAGLYGLANMSLFARETKTSSQFNIPNLDKLCFIGVGGGGANIIEDISKLDDKHTFIHINSDYHSLEQKTSKYKILLGWNEKAGLGCGGKEQCGKSLIDDDVKSNLYKLTKDEKIVYLVSSLGGGVGSGATPEIVEYLKDLNKKVVVFATIPFSFEGKMRFSIAQNSLNKIKLYADNLIVLKNDDLINSSRNKSLGIKESFKITSNNIYKKVSAEKHINQTQSFRS